ncbi:hypothetical protein ACQP1V_08070 [Microtetraspora malaysiensis]|uniref:hypothetical protein n=1 Tax=Microtetraspora malaysiensis TaxID=161358 RepID=UPI003D930AB3
MLRVDTGRLREPAAWIMLAVVATNVLLGVVHLFFGSSSFTLRAMATLPAFVSPVPTALAAAAVLLVTRAGDPTARARLVNLGTMALLGLATLLGLVTMVIGFFAGGSFGDKIEYLILALPQVALTAVGMLFARSSIGADVPRRGAARSEERFRGFPEEGFGGYNPQQALQAPQIQPVSPVQPVQGGGAQGSPSFAPTQLEQAYIPGQEPSFGQAQDGGFGQGQDSSFGHPQDGGFGQSQDSSFGQQESPYGRPQHDQQPFAAAAAGPGSPASPSPVQNPSPAEPYAPGQGYQDGYAQGTQGFPQQDAQPAGQFGAQGYGSDSPAYASEPSAAAVVPYGAQQPSQQQAPHQPGPGQPQPQPQPVQPVQPVQPAPQAFQQQTGGYSQPPQGPMFDQHGYAGQQGEGAGYGAFGSRQDGSPFPPAPQTETPGYANQGYADQGFGQPGYPAAEQAQPYQQESYGHPAEQSYGQQGQQAEQSYGQQGQQAEQPYGQQGHPAEQAYGQQAEQPYGQQGQQGQGAFSGHQGGHFGGQGADQGSSFEQPATAFDPSRPYEPGVDPREQQLAAAYQQAQNYQQHSQPVDYAGSQTAPQDYPDYYDNPLGHSQTPEPSRYSAPSDQTMRFDANLYQGDPLSGPSRREDTIDPTAIYAPERSQAKLEEGVSTEQAGHGSDPQAPWYGSQR